MTLNKAAGKGQWREAFTAACDALKVESLGHFHAARRGRRLPANRQRRMPALRAALGARRHAEGRDRESQSGRNPDAAWPVRSGDQLLAARRAGKPGDEEAAKAISQLSVEKTIQKGGYNQELLQGDDDRFEGARRIRSRARLARPARSDPSERPRRRPKTASRAIAKRNCSRPSRASRPMIANYLELADVFTTQNRLREAIGYSARARWPHPAAAICMSASDSKTPICGVLSIKLPSPSNGPSRKRPRKPVDLAKRMAAQANQAELEVYAARAGRNPGNSLLQYELGLRCKRAGKFKEAIQAFQAARDETRHKALVQLHLGESFQHIRQFKLALSSYEAAVQASDDMQPDTKKLALYRAGVLAAELNDRDGPKNILTQLAAIDFGYRDVAERLDKLAALRDSV